MMTNPNKSTAHLQGSLVIRMLMGAAIGLILISVFVFSVRNANPSWGNLWMIRPIIIVPFAGAIGGLCNYLILANYTIVGVNKAVAIILSVLVFLVGLWLGAVLGLDGTLWN